MQKNLGEAILKSNSKISVMYFKMLTDFTLRFYSFLSISTKPDPDEPAMCWISNATEIHGIENISALVEWRKPAIRKGVVLRYVIEVECSGLDWAEIKRSGQKFELDSWRDLEDCYIYTVSGLPSYSLCAFAIAGNTRVGMENRTLCEAKTPFTRILIYCNFCLEYCVSLHH